MFALIFLTYGHSPLKRIEIPYGISSLSHYVTTHIKFFRPKGIQISGERYVNSRRVRRGRGSPGGYVSHLELGERRSKLCEGVPTRGKLELGADPERIPP